MIRSMTGYGKGETSSDKGRFVVEVRTVNNRYGEISVKLPRAFLSCEHELRKSAAKRIKRGKADIFIQWEPAADAAMVTPLNMAVARGYHDAFQQLADELHLAADIPLSLLISQRNVLQESVGSEDTDNLLPQLVTTVNEALDNLDRMRLQEGSALTADLRTRCNQLVQLKEEVQKRVPQAVAEHQVKLAQRLEKLLGDTQLDPQRLAQEVAVLADRSDITEELVRLASHFKQFANTLEMKESVGRKLDFMMQELNREVNTIGSKSADLEITNLVIEMKAEMEKMREQIQNIE
ncbi:MAG: YicC/YloC family endoribonuclease [Trichlorobacter sp.]|jgi:uncharacterized protein (TIGR00255 family)|nr:YicC/YloC family endoribonuclease [Trichlorobacter sp.]